MTAKTSISLTDDQFAFAKTMVDTGQYPSLSAVLQKGVEVLRQQQQDDDLERAALRALLQARQQDDTLSASEMDETLAGLIAQRRAAHGLDT